MYDLIIIGGGPAGLTAGLYGARGKLNTLVIEKSMEGGQMNNTLDVENYPGIPEGHSGMQLGMRMASQAKNFGAEIIHEEVDSVDFSQKIKKVVTNKKTYEAKAVIIATGANPRKLGVPGEADFANKGVSYCATCDGAFYQDMDVYVIGGGDAAVEEADFLSKFAHHVTIVHRRDELRAAKSIQDKVFKNDKVSIIWDSVLKEIKGDKLAQEILLENVKTKEVTSHKSSLGDQGIGIFIYVGYEPSTDFLSGQVDLDRGYIKTDELMQTSVDGVYAVGDIRANGMKQVVTSAGEGATAALMADKYIAANNA